MPPRFWTGLLLACAVLAASGEARAEAWCVRQFGDPPGRQICAFSSAQDCMRAVFIGGSGICGRQRLPRWIKPTPLDERMWSNPHRLTAW
jgi:hypothetical protein